MCSIVEEFLDHTEEKFDPEITYNSGFPKSVHPGIPRLKDCPVNWKTVNLGKVLKVVSRPAKIEPDQSYRLVTAKRSRGGIIPRGELLGKDILVKTQFYVKEGDFLVSRRQIVHGGCSIVPRELDKAIVSNEYLVLHTTSEFLQEYLNWLSHSIYFQQTCFHSSIGVHIEKMVFKPDWWYKFKFNIPSLPEQAKISKILNCWENGIKKTEKLIEAKQLFKTALMQNLLIGKLRFPEFLSKTKDLTKQRDRNIEYNTIPHNWSTVKYAELGKCIRGVSYKPTELLKNIDKDSVILLRSNNIHNNVLNFKDIQILNKLKVKSEQILRDDDIAICMSNGSKNLVGKAAKYNKANGLYTVGAFCAIFRANNNVNASFIKYLFEGRHYFDQLSSVLAGTNINNLKNSDIESLNAMLPPLIEQAKIADILKACDKEIELLKQKLELLQDQKKDLIQKLLTGQIRVKVDN